MSIDEALERMARWEALRRRMAASGAGPGRGDPIVEELIDVVGTVLHKHGTAAVTLTVEGTGEPVTLRLHWEDGRLAVSRLPAVSAQPAPGSTPAATETSEQTAARLAALIRKDPSVLRNDGVTD
jgi:hypothetical protein